MDWLTKHKFVENKHPRMVRPIYPDGKYVSDGKIYEDFHDFSNGVYVSDEDVNRWIDKGLEYFEKYPDAPYWRVRMGTGNTAVIILKWQDDNSPPYYEIIVTHNYKECNVFPNEPFNRPTEEQLENLESF
jgi:hypothetical protein